MAELVKVCGIVEPADAVFAVQAGADAIGMVLYPPSPRSVRLDQAALVSAVVPSSVLRVGVFVNEEPDRIRSIAAAVRLDVVQLHGGEPPSLVNELEGLRVWKALPVDEEFSAERLDDYDCEAFLLDTKSESYGGTGETFPWHRAVEAAQSHKVILAGGLGADNVAEAIQAAKPWGVDASSRLEIAPGRKDPDKVRAYVDAARSS